MHGINLLLSCLLAAPLPCPPVQDISGETTWGTITQSGYRFTVTHNLWSGTGEVRRNGTVYLMWITCDGNWPTRPAHGVYWITPNRDLVGAWGWTGQTTLETDGTLKGEVRPHTMSRTKP